MNMWVHGHVFYVLQVSVSYPYRNLNAIFIHWNKNILINHRIEHRESKQITGQQNCPVGRRWHEKERPTKYLLVKIGASL